MLPRILTAFIVTPIAEIALFVEVSEHWGAWTTFGTVLATAIAGSIIIRHQGVAVLREVRNEMAAGRLPARQISDGLCLIIVGALLMLPGFLTDTIGFLLMLPIVRRLVIAGLASHIQVRNSSINEAQTYPGGQTIDAEFTDRTDHRSPLLRSDQNLPPSR